MFHPRNIELFIFSIIIHFGSELQLDSILQVVMWRQSSLHLN